MRQRRVKGSGTARHDGRSWIAQYRDLDGANHVKRFRTKEEAEMHLDIYAPIKNTSSIEYFWAQMDRSGDCWLWSHSKTRSGYGRVHWNGKVHPAHRVAYELAKGTIPEGYYVCHACDTPLCCNPDHLWVGTPQENTLDAVRKGRWGCRTKKTR